MGRIGLPGWHGTAVRGGLKETAQARLGLLEAPS